VRLNREDIPRGVETVIVGIHVAFYWVIRSIRIRWKLHVVGVVERRGTQRVWGRNHEGKRPLGRSGRKWKDSVKIDLQGMGRESWDWIYLAQDMDRWRVVKTAMNLRVS
jgi:hypothetical protein